MKLPLTFDELKQKYPYPVSATRKPFGGEYCVGGAFCLMLDAVTNDGEVFPHVAILGRTIAEKTGIDPDKAFDLACEIAVKNDDENFEAAWALIGEIYRLAEQA